MKKISLHTLLLCAALYCMCACGTSSNIDDYNVAVYTPTHATGFRIMGAEGKQSTIIRVTNPWQSANDVETMLFIARAGEKAPAGFRGQVLQGDAKRVVCMSSSHIAMLDAVGAADRVVGVSGVKFISNTTVRARAVEIGYDAALNFENIKGAGTDVILLYGLYGEQSSMTTKLTQLGIPYIYIGDYIESTPLGQAEWIVALSALCGLESEGKEYFTALETRYNTLKQSVANCSSRPKVMLNTPYRDTWFMPSARSYAVALITDAGGEYIYPENCSAQSEPISLEQALILASKADIWLNVGQVESLAQLRRENPKFATVPAVVSGRVYNNTKRTTDNGGSDFWESGAVKADIVLRDMIQMLHHSATTESLYYYKQLK